MTESIPTTWNDERDTAFFGITDTLVADGFTAELATQIDKVLEDLLVAESWELNARRFVARSEPRHRELVPVPVTGQRRSAR